MLRVPHTEVRLCTASELMRRGIKSKALNALLVRVFHESFKFGRPRDHSSVRAARRKEMPVRGIRNTMHIAFVPCAARKRGSTEQTNWTHLSENVGPCQSVGQRRRSARRRRTGDDFYQAKRRYRSRQHARLFFAAVSLPTEDGSPFVTRFLQVMYDTLSDSRSKIRCECASELEWNLVVLSQDRQDTDIE